MSAGPLGAESVAALYDCVITHVRHRPLRHALRHRTYLWCVDPDRLPVLPRPLRPLARFDTRDHFGGTAGSIRAGLDAFLAAHGIDLQGGRVVMLAHARVFGYVFNPLSVYWCHDSSDALVCVVAEVHNTYGQRHCYLLRTDEAGEAEVDKEFYVSPFFAVEGRYRMRLPLPGEHLGLTIRLEHEGGRAFTAAVRGIRRPASVPALLSAAVRRPWSTAAVWAGIRRHGIHLLLRGLPVRPRPRHTPQKGMLP
ncbi:DUF1365 domain-containing protein [Streptomyces filamentosus]|uniref:DUF1365 domain-containing protein n=1 Tax=Streptomyces filamentosus TaxID=67294 RepID=UPI00123989D6|nr:DUF1365 domain-containing protein [Streptomyces filamentosus]KAA6210206.1 DUF1365 domain-containing protein [Streptomyces filamentosus]